MSYNPHSVRGLPKHIESPPFWGRKPSFTWNHSLAGNTGNIFYVPSLDVMCVVPGYGTLQLRDPVSTEILYEPLLTLSSDGLNTAAYVPSCNRIVGAIYEAGSGNRIGILNLNNGETTWITSLASGIYRAAYCPVNDLVYVVSYAGPTVYLVDPWKDALHTTTTVTGPFGGVLLSIDFCPLNGKMYAISRTANNAYQINTSTHVIDSTIATGGNYDIISYSDTLQKMVISSAVLNGSRTIDPLASNAVASISGTGFTCVSHCCVPTTGDEVLYDNTQIRFIDQSGAVVTSVGLSGSKYIGWNPVTNKLWFSDGIGRQMWIMDPVTKSSAVQVPAMIRGQ